MNQSASFLKHWKEHLSGNIQMFQNKKKNKKFYFFLLKKKIGVLFQKKIFHPCNFKLTLTNEAYVCRQLNSLSFGF